MLPCFAASESMISHAIDFQGEGFTIAPFLLIAVTNRRLDGLRLVLRATGVIAVCQVIRLQVRKEECKV